MKMISWKGLREWENTSKIICMNTKLREGVITDGL